MSNLIFLIKLAVVRTLLGLLDFYRFFISPLSGVNCRHLPTCSQYAKDAIIAHGPLHGFCYALKRILRCHPWAKPMIDPVPLSTDRQLNAKYNNATNQRLGE